MNWNDIWSLLINHQTQWVVVALNIVFVLLLIRENIYCWMFGIVASLLSVFLMFDAGLYSETLLYSVYVILGIYAWWAWSRKSTDQSTMPITTTLWKEHLVYISIAVVIWYALGYFFKTYTDSKLPWADAFTTSFAFVATYLEARKNLHHWIYWIILNVFSIWLYEVRGLHIMAFMMFGFAIFSIIGYIIWTRKINKTILSDMDHLHID